MTPTPTCTCLVLRGDHVEIEVFKCALCEAAPALLAALQSCVEWLEACKFDTSGQGMVRVMNAKAAIRQAEGETK